MADGPGPRLSGATDSADADLGLATRAVRGEVNAQVQLWGRWSRWVAAVVLAHKPRRAELEDLLQDVAASFVSRCHEVRDPAALRGWLRTVATNAARASGRSESTRRAHEPAIRLVREHGQRERAPTEPGERVAASDQSGRMLELVNRLPDGYREPLLLRSVRGMSYRAIGEVMGLKERTVETRIARARRMLRELMAQGGGAGALPGGAEPSATVKEGDA
ncbi:MAG: sigma-70 family RNA polymerase sigma factor [Planctomycetota bacterium]